MESYETRLNERRIQFARNTVLKLAEVEVVLNQLSSTPSDMQLLLQANKFFHKLAGAGGIYEMADLCDTTIAAEDICTRAINANQALPPDDLQSLLEKCREIAAICSAVSKPHDG